ncbi:Conjugative transposon protein TraI [Bacteroides xylanisolvens SD CC 1b]|nr:Conjugative transposon protein TraI [Bacteroides xylanisolvens SD CC 1b]
MNLPKVKMLQVSKCLIGLAVMMLQSCDVADNRRDMLCGNWESVEGKPDVLIYKEGEAYKVTVFRRSGLRRKLKPETYLLQEENGNLFMNTGFRIERRVLQRGHGCADFLAKRGLCAGEAAAGTSDRRITTTKIQSNMRTRITMIICLCLLFAGRASAQWVVSDPGNLAQGIINASKNIIHTSKTATNMVSNFQETVKIYQQGKKYYDALKSVNNLVKDARKVQQTILMVGDITDIYVNSFQRMLRDGNFRPEELSAIAFGYTKLLEESNEVLTELRNVVNITTLSMTDKERMDVVERCHSKMKRYRNLVSYYTNKNISVSYLRAKKKNDLDRIMGLYGNMNERYW